jgi:nitrogen fixation protein FixH
VGSDTAPGLSVIQPQDRSKQTLSGKAMIYHFRRRTAQTLDLKVIEGMKRPANANENTALKTSLTLCFAEVLAPSAAAAGEAPTP